MGRKVVSIKTGEYEKDGETKAHYEQVGEIRDGKHGQFFLAEHYKLLGILLRIPVDGGRLLFGIKEFDDDDRRGGGGKSSGGGGSSSSDDNMPF